MSQVNDALFGNFTYLLPHTLTILQLKLEMDAPRYIHLRLKLTIISLWNVYIDRILPFLNHI